MKKYIIVLILMVVPLSGDAQQDEKIQQWYSDIDFIVEQIESVHLLH